MGDYDYCKKHDCSFLMPDLLECPYCAVEKLVKHRKLSDEEREGVRTLLAFWVKETGGLAECHQE